MTQSDNRILKKLLDRLFASLINGPSLNCRPHSSRQRIDLLQLAKLKDQSPEDVLRALLGPDRETKVSAKVPVAKSRNHSKGAVHKDEVESDDTLTPEERAARQAYSEQQSVFSKLRTIAEDARTYENDTGVHVLQIGFPLLSLPPGASGRFGLSRRILAPLAFISLSMSVKAGPTPAVVLECRNEGADLVVPNIALLSWLEQQTGQPVGELFNDETGEKPWAEIGGIAKRVCELVQVEMPAAFGTAEMPADFKLSASPRSDDDEAPKASVIFAAVVGLYPMANQGLLRDMQALVAGEPTTAPIESFIKVDASLEPARSPEEATASPVEKHTRTFAEERLVTTADPCQARAVRLARTTRGLVIHGPPGTGKSQTIANVIGDHLARGERVLFVCDKRTALDVVMNRLQGMGLGALCAIVHDPQRDQRELYKSIREQLDGLADLRSDASADGSISKIDAELQRLHTELTEYHAALMRRPDANALSFHELMGRWLELPIFNVEFDAKLLEAAGHHVVEEHAQALSDLCERAAKVGYVSNPWSAAAGLTLETYLTNPVEVFREEVASFRAPCESADAAIDPATPPIPSKADLTAVAAARARLADELERVRAEVPGDLRKTWAPLDPKTLTKAAQTFTDAPELAAKVESSPLDRELLMIVRDAIPNVPQIAEQIGILDAYIETTKKFLGFLAFGKKFAAAKVLTKFGLQPSGENAMRVRTFLLALKSRLVLKEVVSQVASKVFDQPLPDDEAMLSAVKEHRTLFGFLATLQNEPNLADVRALAAQALAQPDDPADLMRGLRATAVRVEKVHALEAALSSAMFSPASKQKWLTDARAGHPLLATADALQQRFDSLENVLRVREGLDALPPSLRPAAAKLVTQNINGEIGLLIVRRASDSNEIVRRLKVNRMLMTADSQKLQSSFSRYEQHDQTKKQLTRQAVIHRWARKQRERLLATTGSRLNGLGADLRRRLTIRGERAMRLRQVVHVGQNIEGGDPLYDLRPVWMASPETVAQLFPRSALFDVVIFDEASQCRLEEALPVLLRAKRVVIAGDPKQLPPTRFFESAVAVSEDEEIETDQQLFETQQGEIEDLLAAALNIEIEECYLDVHYRSRNSDLIEFSNDKFYNSRLQAIPGHPANRTRFAPLSVYKVNGTYEKRANPAEAEKVCQIVRDLLKRAEPPSIGIACFNITQRDEIIEKLEELAAADSEFAKSLAAARERRSASSFEGLFVKNLENVQGDERDHMIISTTYGPDPKGRFYRRFGPLGSAGGGRRLNVLVTRARDEVHLVTSIPETVYRNLPPIPPGETPGGAWLLFSYLVYAERLAEIYEENNRILDQAQAASEPVVNVRATRFPSKFSDQLALRLHRKHKIGSDVHWGNDGFCVDVALHHPERAEDVTIGVLCDMNRFEQASDPVEWEVFRTAILKGQGWKFNRVWTPHFFRDRETVTQNIVKDAETIASETDDPDAIRTTPS